MLHKMQVQTPEGLREYKVVPNGMVFDQARGGGEIVAGDEIIYRGAIVWLQSDFSMVVIGELQRPMVPQFVGGNVQTFFTM